MNSGSRVVIVKMAYSVFGKLPTYPSPKPTFCPKGEVSFNVGLGKG